MKYKYPLIICWGFMLLSGPTALCQSIFYASLADSAATLADQRVRYDPTYFSIDYPYGDVPADRGVCSDVVIRAYRKMGIDLQTFVHEDMKSHFQVYPNHWGLRNTDRNIDHRRVPNLMTFFKRHGVVLPITQEACDYVPGDVVCWQLSGGRTHIGILVDQKSSDSERFLVIHNIGAGQVIEDCLFDFKIIGHYRFGKDSSS